MRVAEHVLAPGAYPRAGGVALLLARRQRMVARAAAVDAAFIATLGKVFLRRGRAIGAVGPHLGAGIAGVNGRIDDLTAQGQKTVFPKVEIEVAEQRLPPAL